MCVSLKLIILRSIFFWIFVFFGGYIWFSWHINVFILITFIVMHTFLLKLPVFEGFQLVRNERKHSKSNMFLHFSKTDILFQVKSHANKSILGNITWGILKVQGIKQKYFRRFSFSNSIFSLFRIHKQFAPSIIC